MTLIELLPWAAIVFLMLGFTLNIYKYYTCWFAWITCSLIWLLYATLTGQTGLIANNIICLFFHGWGIYQWRKPEIKKKD
tara:strand:- start:3233 stop:3472 length:240 start_codon:yes stop_codon:yes gene_type:complete